MFVLFVVVLTLVSILWLHERIQQLCSSPIGTRRRVFAFAHFSLAAGACRNPSSRSEQVRRSFCIFEINKNNKNNNKPEELSNTFSSKSCPGVSVEELLPTRCHNQLTARGKLMSASYYTARRNQAHDLPLNSRCGVVLCHVYVRAARKSTR